MTVPLVDYLIVGAILFTLGLFGFLRRTNVIMVLMSIELMLNAVNLNLLAFSRFLTPDRVAGQIFALFIITVAAAEAAVGLGIVIMLVRRRDIIDINKINLLRG